MFAEAGGFVRAIDYIVVTQQVIDSKEYCYARARVAVDKAWCCSGGIWSVVEAVEVECFREFQIHSKGVGKAFLGNNIRASGIGSGIRECQLGATKQRRGSIAQAVVLCAEAYAPATIIVFSLRQSGQLRSATCF